MKRRAFLMTLAGFFVGTTRADDKRRAPTNRTFLFKIKTKGKSIIRTRIQARDIEAAKVKLFKRYPGCQILEGREV